MKPITAILCLVTLLCNVALAGVGGIEICIDKGADGAISIGCARQTIDPCCPEQNAQRSLPVPGNDCESCLDGRIDASKADDATSGADRAAAKAPAEISRWPGELAEVSVALERFSSRPLPRAAGAQEPGAREHFAKTVSFRL